jgi:hypothetical protein
MFLNYQIIGFFLIWLFQRVLSISIFFIIIMKDQLLTLPENEENIILEVKNLSLSYNA